MGIIGQLTFHNRSSGELFPATKQLIWLYFWLLMFEGAVRKWVLPQFSGPLLIIRDPILLLCYASAVREGCFPKNAPVVATLVLGAVALGLSASCVVLGVTDSTLIITMFGFRASFLHLPLIFIIARVLRREDVETIGKCLLMLSLPMAALVFFQFKSPPDAWVNVGAGAESGQISVAVGGVNKIRPSGLFSFSSGLSSFVCLTAAFVLFHFVRGKVFTRWLGVAGAATVLVMIALAMSRATAVSVTMVGLAAIVAALLRPEFLKSAFRVLAVGGGLWLALGIWSEFDEGLAILRARVDEAEGVKVGMLERFGGGFIEPFTVAASTPPVGHGLGVGTNVGAQLLSGSSAFLLAEGEWARAVMEMGPIIGFAYLLLRLALAGLCVATALAVVREGDILPLLLCSASVLLLVNGQFSQATALGFGVFGAGLTLAAANRGVVSCGYPQNSSKRPTSVTPGRSVHAKTLHGNESKPA